MDIYCDYEQAFNSDPDSRCDFLASYMYTNKCSRAPDCPWVAGTGIVRTFYLCTAHHRQHVEYEPYSCWRCHEDFRVRDVYEITKISPDRDELGELIPGEDSPDFTIY